MGKRGPKPSGVDKVVFYRRVSPAMVPLLDEVLRSDGKVLVNYVVPKVDPELIMPETPQGDVLALLEDVERLEREKTALEERVQRVARLTDNEKLILWIRKYDQLAAKVKAKYPDEVF